MLKWYEKEGKYTDVVLSGRIRLARNMEKYPFSAKLSNEEASKLVKEIEDSNFVNENKKFKYIKLKEIESIYKSSLVERHIISNDLIQKEQDTAFLISDDESVSLLVNEEDHIRIQVIVSGMNIDKAFLVANQVDDDTYEEFGYAFDEKYGYLTSCPTNMGTGLRVSYMLHLPALESAGKLQGLVQSLATYGMTIRGIYGEGSKSQGNFYQISNQKTLGQNEGEIMGALNNIVLQIIRQERKRREYSLSHHYNYIEDQIYRSYGVLKYARQITVVDAMTLLSQLRLGMLSEMIHFNKEFNMYKLMSGVQPGNLQMSANRTLGNTELDIKRAEYIRNYLPDLSE